jgi:hypothetical protein
MSSPRNRDGDAQAFCRSVARANRHRRCRPDHAEDEVSRTWGVQVILVRRDARFSKRGHRAETCAGDAMCRRQPAVVVTMPVTAAPFAGDVIENSWRG